MQPAAKKIAQLQVGVAVGKAAVVATGIIGRDLKIRTKCPNPDFREKSPPNSRLPGCPDPPWMLHAIPVILRRESGTGARAHIGERMFRPKILVIDVKVVCRHARAIRRSDVFKAVRKFVSYQVPFSGKDCKDSPSKSSSMFAP